MDFGLPAAELLPRQPHPPRPAGAVPLVSPAGSVGASACGRGCHWQPAPRLRGSQGCFGFKKKFSVKVELPCPLRRRRGWIARRARRVRFEPARCALFPARHIVAPPNRRLSQLSMVAPFAPCRCCVPAAFQRISFQRGGPVSPLYGRFSRPTQTKR